MQTPVPQLAALLASMQGVSILLSLPLMSGQGRATLAGLALAKMTEEVKGCVMLAP